MYRVVLVFIYGDVSLIGGVMDLFTLDEVVGVAFDCCLWKSKAQPLPSFLLLANSVTVFLFLYLLPPTAWVGLLYSYFGAFYNILCCKTIKKKTEYVFIGCEHIVIWLLRAAVMMVMIMGIVYGYGAASR